MGGVSYIRVSAFVCIVFGLAGVAGDQRLSGQTAAPGGSQFEVERPAMRLARNRRLHWIFQPRTSFHRRPKRFCHRRPREAVLWQRGSL
jgi:hypothetical protein